MATTVVVLIIIIILLLLVKIFHDKETLPGPWNLPVIGYLHKLDPIAPYLTLTKLAQKYGPIYSIKIGMVKVVVIADAKLLKKVLSKDETLIRPSLYLINTSFEHKGMSHAPIDVWKDQRKFVANFLRTVGAAKVSPNKKACEKLIRKHVDEFVQVVQNQAFCQPLDPSELITHLVSSTASSIYLGKPFSLNDTKVADLAQNVHVFTKLIMFGAPLNFLPVLRFLPPYKNKLKSLKKAVRRVHEIQATLIDECEKSTCVDSRLNLVNAFQLQISEGKPQHIYNMDQLHYLLFDLYVTFTETTMCSLLWILLYLAQYPEVQNKMRQELYHVVQDKTVQVDDFANLHYIRATIAEVARNRTLIPLGIPHSVSEKICVDGFTIPKGVMIMPLLWAIHMDPKFHKEPEEFHPERFLDSDGKFSKPESFLPFQSGKRKCIGEDVAEIMTSIFIAGVLQNFRIEQVDSTPLDFTGICGVTLAPKPQKLIFSKI
ncbi:cytochrome P450 306a1-like isoform X1 [Zophobas morio]|uniref:cytochrome P450 306a1-like isoform X1 n=1 Tax=Zophobas morio TaxID=2755281 RepID=UPI003082DF8D